MQETVFVVTEYSYTDDYKRSQCQVETSGVFRSKRDALKTACRLFLTQERGGGGGYVFENRLLMERVLFDKLAPVLVPDVVTSTLSFVSEDASQAQIETKQTQKMLQLLPQAILLGPSELTTEQRSLQSRAVSLLPFFAMPTPKPSDWSMSRSETKEIQDMIDQLPESFVQVLKDELKCRPDVTHKQASDACSRIATWLSLHLDCDADVSTEPPLKKQKRLESSSIIFQTEAELTALHSIFTTWIDDWVCNPSSYCSIYGSHRNYVVSEEKVQ